MAEPCLSIGELAARYTSDKFSPFQRVKPKTQIDYRWCCTAISRDFGNVKLAGMLGEDIWRIYQYWAGEGTDKPTPSKASHLITMLRMICDYGILINAPGAIDLQAKLKAMRFPGTAARTVAPTYTQARAVAEKAIEMGFLSIAITTIAQFELVERRISIIGAWEGANFRPGWRWEDISADWVIRYTQRKVGVVVREFNLTAVPYLYELLQRIPNQERIGHVVKDERSGMPWSMSAYVGKWREVARAAGLPDEIKSMDMRAGGATEADSIEGVTERDLKESGGWKSNVFNRYTRAPQRRANAVVRMRQELR
jgi:hypothetical protein